MRLVPLFLILLAGAPGDAPDPASPARIAALIRDLGADDWDVRERAYRELEKLGPRAARYHAEPLQRRRLRPHNNVHQRIAYSIDHW